MPVGRFRLVRVLREAGVPDKAIREALHSELGLTPAEADAALQHEDEPAAVDLPDE